MNDFLTRVKTEPTVVIQGAQVLLGLLLAFNVLVLSDDQTGSILALTAAALGLFNALAVRPFSWPAVTGLVQAAVVLLAAFGLELSDTQTSGVYSAVAFLGLLIVRQGVTPETKLGPVALAQPETWDGPEPV